jgi:hypothetical protein
VERNERRDDSVTPASWWDAFQKIDGIGAGKSTLLAGFRKRRHGGVAGFAPV